MEDYEARLEAVRRQLADQEHLVEVQRGLVGLAQQSGLSGEKAERMLQAMEKTLTAFRADLARLSN